MSDTVMGDTITDRVPNMAGSTLRTAREKANLSVEEVAAKLKLSTRQIVAIEAEDWANLPERTFTRGFFYSYARLVGVDKSVIDTSFSRRSAALGEMRTLPEGKGEVTDDNTSAPGAYSKWLIPGVLLAVLLAGIAWFIYKDVPFPQASSKLPIEHVAKSQTAAPSPASAAATAPVVAAPAPVSATAESTTTTQPSASTPSLLGQPTPNAASSTLPQNTASPQGNSAPTPSATSPTLTPSATLNAPPAAAPATAAPTTPSAPAALAAGQRRIRIEASGRSWSEARAGGEVVLSEMLNGTSREFVAKGPISFVIGNSSNVKLTIDGKPYDFSPHVRNEVARFRVE